MTTISFGGGPTIQQRRDFAGLQEGAQVPGYRGYVPQLKYDVGLTYGEATHQLSASYDFKHPVDFIDSSQPKNVLQNQLPLSTGDNKYTVQMVPGYTGYVPRMPFKFGGTYKEDCDVCIDQHLTNMNTYSRKAGDLRQSVKANVRLQPLKYDPQVRDHLNTYRDTHPERPMLMEDKRAATEPPMPGYQGYVPRIYTTEQGLGCRYHQMTKNGLETFRDEQDFHKAVSKRPITIDRIPGVATKTPLYTRRLYPNGGMIPKYTGYVPQRMYHIGNTYGDTTRSLEVCAHNRSSFGEHMATKSMA